MSLSSYGAAKWRAILFAPLLVADLSCGGADSATGPQTAGGKVTQIQMTPDSAAIVAGQSTTFTATPLDALGAEVDGQTVSWSTNDTSVATVAAGVVAAHNPGKATITASVGSVQGHALLTVTPLPAAKVIIDPSSVSLYVGQAKQLSATVEDTAGDVLQGRAVTWSVSDTTVISVSSSGLVTALKVGQATVTALSEGKTGSAAISVSLTPVSKVVVTPSIDTVYVGQNVQLTATAEDSAGNPLSSRVVTWSSTDTTLATVTSTGVITASVATRNTGTVSIVATSEGRSGSSVITVNPVPPPDVTPPNLLGLTVSPDTVDNGTTDALIHVTMRWADAGTGVVGVQVLLLPPSGSGRQCGPTQLTSGTKSDGVWTCDVTIPKGTATGTWHLTWVEGGDGVQNYTTVNEATLQGSGYRTTVQVTSSVLPDVTPPNLLGLTISPDTVDNTTADQIVHVDMHWADAGTGVAGVQVLLIPPAGNYRQCGPTQLVSGTTQDGTWECDVTIPKGTATGVWHLSWVEASDELQNNATVNESTLQTAGYRTTLQVTSTVPPDITPPNLLALNITPDTVDNSAADAIVHVSMHWADAGSGVAGVQVLLTPPSGYYRQCGPTQLVSGTSQDGIWTCDVTIPKGTATGAWHLTWVEGGDALQNYITINESTLQQSGYPTIVIVTNSAP